MKNKLTYPILVIKTEDVETFTEGYYVDSFEADQAVPYSWVARNVAEEDTSYLQPIPYVSIKCKNKIALFLRYKGGEKRLAGRYTIGIAGHIEMKDALWADTVYEIIEHGAIREIQEELVISPEFIKTMESCDHAEGIEFIDLRAQGTNNEGVNDVHLGIPITIKLTKKIPMVVNGDELKFIGWKTKEELQKLDNLEDWSLYLVNNET